MNNFYAKRAKITFCINLLLLILFFTYFLILCTRWDDVHQEINQRRRLRSFLAKEISSFTNIEDKNHTFLEENYGSNWVRDLYVPGFSAIGNRICPNHGSELQLLILVLSHPSGKYQRLILRRTWGTIALRKDISVAFLLGQSSAVPKRKIQKELELYQDLIIINNGDSYQNLTLKSISMLEYVSTHCNLAKFVLKLDDDVYVHINLLLRILNFLDGKKRGIYGKAIKNVGPIREQKSKYYVSRNFYKKPLYPYYMNGPAYIFPAHIAEDMYIASYSLPYIPMEDVFITGVLAEYLNIARYESRKFRIVDLNTDPIEEEMIFFHRSNATSHFVLWYLLHRPVPKKVRFTYTKNFLNMIFSKNEYEQ